MLKESNWQSGHMVSPTTYWRFESSQAHYSSLSPSTETVLMATILQSFWKTGVQLLTWLRQFFRIWPAALEKIWRPHSAGYPEHLINTLVFLTYSPAHMCKTGNTSCFQYSTCSGKFNSRQSKNVMCGWQDLKKETQKTPSSFLNSSIICMLDHASTIMLEIYPV